MEELGYTVPDALTWDFIWEVSEAAPEKGADGTYVLNGRDVMIPFIYKSTDNMMIQMLRQQDAGYSTAAARSRFLTILQRIFCLRSRTMRVRRIFHV